ncbi:hypothetical protein CWO90_12950 [Bradyrhizobium sp. Leo121]|nr:hypothetical protein CWO90_12950 [Bradyrhizobium sp. Leo121]
MALAAGRSPKGPIREIPAIIRRITITRTWTATTGGPHLLIADEQLRYWRGIEGWRDHRDPADQSDYARACRVTTWLGLIACHHGSAVVLSGPISDDPFVHPGCRLVEVKRT